MRRILIFILLGLLLPALGAAQEQSPPQGVLSVTGTTDQITCTTTSGAVVCGTPQNTTTTSTPQFDAIGIGGAAGSAHTFKMFGTTSGSISFSIPAVAGTTTAIAFPATTGTVITTGDTGTVTNTMLAGSIAASKLTGSDIATVGTITSGVWTGTAIGVAKGGTGIDASGITDGQILIGKTSDHTLNLATLTQGANITITNGAGAITIAAAAGGWAPAYTAKTSTYNPAVANDLVAATGTFTVTLPAASTNANKVISVANVSTGIITVAITGGDTVGQAATQTLAPGDSMTFVSDGTSNWIIL